MNSTLVRDNTGLVRINYMFTGLRCIELCLEQFEDFNGFRVTMRPPANPCKLGIYLQTNLSEYEHFIGHLLDTGSETPQEWVDYEIPVRLMVHNLIKSKMIQA